MEMGVWPPAAVVFERRPGLMHAAVTGLRPAWNAFADIVRRVDAAGALPRPDRPIARRALDVLDRRQATAAVDERESAAAEDGTPEVGTPR